MRPTRKRIHSSEQVQVSIMLSLKLHTLMIWLHAMGAWAPLTLAFIGVALFAGCALGCGSAPCKEKDGLFRREVY